jgi:hypothetical protein
MAAGTMGTRAAPVPETDASALEPAARAAGGFKPEGAAAAEHDGVDMGRDVRGAHDVEFLAAGSAAANVHTGHGAAFAEDHRTAGEGLEIGGVADADAVDGGDTLHERYCFTCRSRCAGRGLGWV